MNGIPQDKSNGHRCNISDDSNSDGIVKRGSFDSMSEGWDEEGNGKKSKNKLIMKIEE
jgi:hypothetical protein